MTTSSTENERDGKVVLAWAVLILQIIGLVWLLLFGEEQVAALRGVESIPVGTGVVEATPGAEGAAPTSDAAADAAATTAVEPTAEPTEAVEEAAVALPTAEEAGVISPDDVTVDSSVLAPGSGMAAPEWLAQLVEGVTPDPDAEKAGIPPHLLLGFQNPAQPGLELAAPEAIDLTKPQVRVVPIAALLAWLQARNDTAGQEALEDLQSLLEEQPAPDQASVPTAPVLGDDANQALVARVAYEGFNGGTGVAYIARVTGDNVLPVTNESGLNFIFQGVTADGTQYVFMSWPVAAAFLPNTAADVPADAGMMLESDPVAYYNAIRDQLASAADDDLSPAQSQLSDLIASLNLTGEPASQTASGSPEDAVGFVWNWTGSRGGDGDETAVENPQDYALVFWPDGTFSFKADCNVGRGAYTVNDDGTVSLQPGPMTMAACPPGSLDSEFLQTVAATQSLAFDESGDMILTLADGRSAVFANVGQAESGETTSTDEQPDAADAGFTGITLQWPGYTDAAGNVVEVDNPEDYTLVLLPDGTYTFQADCNVGGGAYEYAEDGTLTLLPGLMTLVACEEGSQADAFLAFLGGVSGVSVADDGSVTMTTADGSSATFISAGPVASPDIEPAPEDALIGTVWQWTGFQDSAELNDLTVEDPESYLLTFLPDGAFTLKADCNIGRGSYTRDANSLSMTVGPMTRAACDPDSLSDRYVQFLNATASYVFDDEGGLVLNLIADSGNLTFADGGPVEMPEESAEAEEQPDAADAGVTGITLQWPGFTDATGNAIEVENPEDYFLVLLPDGTFTFKADCNVGSGTYEYGEGGALTLITGPMTRAACPEGSQSDTFVSFLNSVESVDVDEAGNPTLVAADGASATFVNLGPVEVPEDATAGTTAPEGDLLDTVWQWSGLSDVAGTVSEIENPELYYLVLLDDGTYTFVADCNRGAGGYTLDGASLTLNPAAMTLVACAEGSLSDQFVGLLGQVESYAFDGDDLVLSLTDGGFMTLANAGPFTGMDTGGGAAAGDEAAAAQEALVGSTWQWATFRDAKQDYSVPAETAYTILFNADGTAEVVADCNSGGGSYTTGADGSITISILRMTRAACPPGSLSDSFVEYLNQAGTYTAGNGALTVELMADGGMMTFVALP